MHKIPVFYQPEQSSTDAASFSPSAGKPALVMADWLSDERIAPYLDVRSFDPVSRDTLYGVHDPYYVDGVLDEYIDNGFGNTSPGIAASLPYTVGSIVAAAKHVLTNNQVSRPNTAVSLTSGFHHAGHDYGSGFCTFNGLMAAAVEVHRLGLAQRILILDFDAHYGDGTDDIIGSLGIDYVTNITAHKSYKTASEALALSSRVLMNQSPNHYDLVLFQAGADIHVDDPLGGLLTTRQMQERDDNVFIGSMMRDTPVVWNLAGGYNTTPDGGLEPVLQLHRQTMLRNIHWNNLKDSYEKRD